MDGALLDQLEAEHRQVEGLFAELEDAEDEATQRPLVDRLVQSLTKHMAVEEREVYPEVAKLDGEMEQEAQNEHGMAREGLTKLQEMIGQPGFGAAVAMLKAGIEHHVEEEESEVFPKLRTSLGLASANAPRDELYEQARKAGIEGRSTMTKEELAKALGPKSRSA
jgi:hemerythrin superfamily protein